MKKLNLWTFVVFSFFLQSQAFAMPGDMLSEDAYLNSESNPESEALPEDFERNYDPDTRGVVTETRSSRRPSRSQGRTTSRRSTDSLSSFDDVRLHGGVAIVQSIQQIALNDSGTQMGTASTRGIQANLGIDLFSQHWIAEGSVLNYPEFRQDNFSVASNAFELKLLYTGAVSRGLTLHGGPGICSRNFTIKVDNDPAQKLGGQRTISTANTVFVAGANYWVSGSLSIGLEGAARIPMTSSTDPQSTDLGIRIDGHF